MPARSPEALERLSKAQHERYLDRKARQVCVYCECELGPDDGSVCASCEEERAPRQAVWRASASGRKVRNRNQRDFIKRRYDAGLCVVCTTPREQWAPPSPEQAIKRAALAKAGRFPQKCPTCADEYSVYHRRRDRLEREGVLDLERERRRREKDAKLEAAKAALEAKSRRYVAIDEVVESTRYRLLSTLARAEWATARELFDAIGLPEFDESNRTERDRFSKSLERFVKRGLVVYREFRERSSRGARTGNGGDYRITSLGRESLAELKRQTSEVACRA